MPVYADPVGGVAIRAGSLTTWNADLVERLGTPTDIAADVAVVLLASDRRGIASHGTARLARYAALAGYSGSTPPVVGR
jgi:LDH2 family malate/lactate/ureidoglycolate dehydrogenase